MRLFLLRHGQSLANVDKSINVRMPDHAIDLTPTGEQQATDAGLFFRQYQQKNPLIIPRVWISPYKRTRRTAENFMKEIVQHLDYRENISLVEQQFGLFDGIEDDQLPILYPNEYAHYKKAQDFEGRFWASMPLGESRWKVCLRVHELFGTFQRDRDKHGINDLVIVTHGVVVRAITMMWCHKNWEWFEAEPNPKNCSIRLIEDGEDQGYIYEGVTDIIPSRTETI